MSDSNAPAVVDDIDDVCSCDSVYHSFVDTTGGPRPPAPAIPPTPTPPTQTFSIPEPDAVVLKDQRSHDRARQRLKKPEDVSKGKRCVRCSCCKPWKWAGNEGRPKEKSRGLRTTFTEGKGDSKVGLDASIDLAEDEHYMPPMNRDVSLADFVKAPRKASEKRFEIISRPRQVLVLDEFTEVDPSMLDLDEWEHIDVESSRKATAPSYAAVVANRA